MSKTQNISKANRIASNTFILFFRMFVITIINLYTVRLVLNGLGVIDYGIYNAVAGVVTTTSFITSILEMSVQRFYSVSLGKNDFDSLRKIFSISLKATTILAIVILILFETIGLWFIANKLNIPTDRTTATFYCFHFSLIAFIFALLQIPYSAAIFSHEDMNVYAAISSCDCILKFIVAIILGSFACDQLILYSIALSIVAFITFLNYCLYGKKKYTECKYKNVKDSKLVKNILSFSGWTMFGSISKVGMIQGSAIILNLFFGPTTNAAFAISVQISNAFNALSNSMILAVRPSMIKAYSNASNSYLYKTFNLCNKFLLYLFLAISIPMISNMGTILKVWLHEVSKETVLFAQLTIIYIIVLAMNNPITIIIQASGNIKNYFVSVESISILCVPITYIAFLLGSPSEWIFYSMIGVCIIAHLVRLMCLKKQFTLLKYKDYIVLLCLPAVAIISLGIIIEIGIGFIFKNPFIHIILSSILLPTFILGCSYIIGLTNEEKEVLKKIASTYINKFISHKKNEKY